MITEPIARSRPTTCWGRSARRSRGACARRLAARTGGRCDCGHCALAATATGSFAGGTYHGFGTVLPAQLARAIWAGTTIVVGMAACLLLSATLTAAVPRTARRWLLVAVWGQFAVYAAWMLRHDAFVNVIVEYGWRCCSSCCCISPRRGFVEPSTRWVVAGVALTFAAAFSRAVRSARHLNHNDLQHLVQMVAVWFLYKGGSNLRDTPV